MGIDVPQSACIRRYLVCKNDIAVESSKLDLKVDQLDSSIGKELLQDFNSPLKGVLL